MVALGLVVGQLRRQQQLAQEQPRAELARHQVGVLALPAMARRLRHRLLHQRRGVDEHFQVVAIGVPDEAAERLELCLHHVVIVAALGVDGDRRALVLGEHGERVAGRSIVQRQRHHGARLGPQGRGIGALLGALAEPAHVALVALRDEGAEFFQPPPARLRREVGGREAHGIEAQPQRLLADGIAQRRRARLPGRTFGCRRSPAHRPR